MDSFEHPMSQVVLSYISWITAVRTNRILCDVFLFASWVGRNFWGRTYCLWMTA